MLKILHSINCKMASAVITVWRGVLVHRKLVIEKVSAGSFEVLHRQLGRSLHGTAKY